MEIYILHSVNIKIGTHTGFLDVFTSFVWFRSAFIRDDLPTLVLPMNATYRKRTHNNGVTSE